MNFFKNLLNGINRFFSTMVKSCYDMEFYRSVRTGTLNSALKYAVALHFFLMLVVTSILFPMTLGAKARLAAFIEKTVPDNASITLSKGHMSTTLSVPYDIGSGNLHFVIDPSHEGQDFPEKLDEPGMLLGRDALFVRRSANATETYDLKDIPDAELTKEKVLGWFRAYGPSVMAAGLGLFALMYWILFLGSTLFTVAIYSVMAMLFGMLFKTRLRYGQWYASGLHAVTLPILVSGLFTLFQLHVSYAFTFIFFMIMAAIITDERSNPVDGLPTEDEKVPMPTETPEGEDAASDDADSDEKPEDDAPKSADETDDTGGTDREKSEDDQQPKE